MTREESANQARERDAGNQRPLVSVILAVFNERDHIAKCMASLQGQETAGFELEILAVDGGSNDGTREYLEKAASSDPRVRVLDNKQRKAPFAFNLGLREARGEYVCICGAHSIYAKDYISVCFSELLARSVLGCGGRVVTQPSANTLQARLVAILLGHPFGSSRNSVRTRNEGFWTAAFMVIRKGPLVEAGGYCEELYRNQDNDTYQKLESKGYRFFCTWKTHCIYHPKASIREILAYAFKTGLWNAISFRQNPSSMAPRHFIPFFFVMSILITAVLGLAGVMFPIRGPGIAAVPLVVLVTLHLIAGSIAAGRTALKERFAGALVLPFVFFAFHFSYGLGTLWAFLSRAKASRFMSDALGSEGAFGKTAAGN